MLRAGVCAAPTLSLNKRKPQQAQAASFKKSWASAATMLLAK